MIKLLFGFLNLPKIMEENQDRPYTASALVVFFAAVLGFAAYAYVSFARAENTQVLEKKINDIARQQDATAAEFLEQRIFDTRKEQCGAMTPDAKVYFREKLFELMKRYFQLTQRNYDLPTCKELGYE